MVGEDSEDGPGEGEDGDDEDDEDVVWRQDVFALEAVDEPGEHAHHGDQGEDLGYAPEHEEESEQHVCDGVFGDLSPRSCARGMCYGVRDCECVVKRDSPGGGEVRTLMRTADRKDGGLADSLVYATG